MHSLAWVDPATLLMCIPPEEEQYVFLYSSMATSYSGSHSYLALFPELQYEGSDPQAWQDEAVSATATASPLDYWFGYFSYELRHNCEANLHHAKPFTLKFPGIHLARYGAVFCWNHKKHTLHLFCCDQHEKSAQTIHATSLKKAPNDNHGNKNNQAVNTLTVSKIHSTMDKTGYLKKVNTIKEAIKNGDLYQANLTRKFYGQLMQEADDLRSAFLQLCQISPAPYSSLLRFKNRWVLSSSPEKFLTADSQRHVTSRPIKGSKAKSANGARILSQSVKDKSENLMITDLMRNDLSRICKAGSIRVDGLYDIDDFTTIHHMASNISGTLRPETDAAAFIRACFPPGSMTGTPKISAMELCTKLEGVERCIYSGAIGWIATSPPQQDQYQVCCDLAVTIRTLLVENDYFETQAGGAIVYDSDPEDEWQETLTKLTAIRRILNIEEKDLATL